MDSPGTSPQVMLEFKNISKAFGECQANRNISFKVNHGSIHALIGENGAGKSTLMKILFGIYQADSGEIFLQGQKVHIDSPLRAKALHIGMVHQHFMLAGPIPAIDHILLEQTKEYNFLNKWILPISRKKVQQELEALSEKFNMPVPWTTKIEELSVGIQQRIEILKLLYNDSNILILDEPTAVLTPQEVEKFFAQLRELKAHGKTIVLITHKLKEVLSVADEFTVLRRNEMVYSGSLQGETLDSLAEKMIGRKIKSARKKEPIPESQPLLETRDLCLIEKEFYRLNKVNLNVHPGEIVGIAGVEGNGQSDLIQCLLRPQQQGTKLKGEIFLAHRTIHELNSKTIRNRGVRYFPEDRLLHGAIPDLPAKDNFLLGLQNSSEFVEKGFIKQKVLTKTCHDQMKKFDVRPLQTDLVFKSFSGGNQQKLVVARELHQRPQLLVCAQPTRGVDIGAREMIHEEILFAKSQGSGILLISSELDEILALSDRLYVFFKGQIVGEFTPSEFDERRIGALMGGQK